MDELESKETSGTSPGESDVVRLTEALEASRSGERAAVERLRMALLASEPALEAAMVSGETVAEVEASFAAATALLARIRERAAAESAARVPAGAPGRQAARPRTAFEKIREGLSHTG
jgi:hypothetical protein